MYDPHATTDVADEAAIMSKGRLVKVRLADQPPPNVYWQWFPIGNCAACKYKSGPSCLNPKISNDKFLNIYSHTNICPQFKVGVDTQEVEDNPGSASALDMMKQIGLVEGEPSQEVDVLYNKPWSVEAAVRAHQEESVFLDMARHADYISRGGSNDPSRGEYVDLSDDLEREQDTNETTLSVDASGHQHKDKGEGGGQFTKGGAKSSIAVENTFSHRGEVNHVTDDSGKAYGEHGKTATVVNPHLATGRPVSLNFKPSQGITEADHLGTHELLHQVYSNNSELGKEIADKLAKINGPYGSAVSMYGAFEGMFENVIELGAAYSHSPEQLKEFSSEMYELAKEWADRYKKGQATSLALEDQPRDESGRWNHTGKKRVAVIGLAANPPHAGHLALARHVRDKGGFDEVWMMPANKHVFKPDMAPAEHRLAMTKAMLEGERGIKVSDAEIRNNLSGPTIHAVEKLKEESGDEHDFSWVISQDEANQFNHWVRHDELEKMVPFVVTPRPGVVATEGAEWSQQEPHRVMVDRPDDMVDISSTQLRAMLKDEAFDSEVGEHLHPKVLDYIRANNLYK